MHQAKSSCSLSDVYSYQDKHGFVHSGENMKKEQVYLKKKKSIILDNQVLTSRSFKSLTPKKEVNINVH